MKETLIKYRYLLIAVLFLLLVYAIIPSINYTNCLGSQRFIALSFDGIVVNKYLDKSQHSTPIVEIENAKASIDSIYFFGDHSGLFERIDLKDTIKKNIGSNEILIKRGGSYLRLGIADFKCDTLKFEDEKFLSRLYDIFGTIPSNSKSNKE